MSSLSVIIITKNESENIERCLKSVQWADEIIVIDSGSEDDTVSKCLKYTEHVYSMDWPGYGPQKNRALAKASKEWVLSIDADEWLSDDLQLEIRRAIKEQGISGYSVRASNYYFGKVIQYGDWGKDRKTCLFRRLEGSISNDIVHERVIVNGEVKKLKHQLFHESYKDLDEALEKMNLYTTLTAKMRKQNNKSSSFTKALVSSTWAFFRGYIIRRGFLDGKAGFMLAVYLAENSFYRNIKAL